MKNVLLGMISAVLLLVSCSKDDDHFPPEIGPGNLTELSMDINGKLWQSIGPNEKILDARYIVINKEDARNNKHMILITAVNTNNLDGKLKRFKGNIELKTPLVKGSYSGQSNNILEYSFHFFDEDYKSTYHNEIWYPGTVSATLPFSFTITEISKVEDKGDLSIYRIRGTFNLKMVNENNDNEIITITNGEFK